MSSPSLRPKQAAALLGMSRITLWRLSSNRADFPKPIRLTPRLTVYDRDSLIAWRDAQVGAAQK